MGDQSSLARKVKATANLLHKTKVVDQYDDGAHIEAEALALAIWDMDESFRKLIAEIFPRLERANIESEEVGDILWDIRDELKHIIYHINDSKALRDLLSDK